jgi:hypothetical protein
MTSEQCLTCLYKDASPSEGWCYLHAKEPVGKCKDYLLDRSSDAQTIQGIAYLERNFPDKFN